MSRSRDSRLARVARHRILHLGFLYLGFLLLGGSLLSGCGSNGDQGSSSEKSTSKENSTKQEPSDSGKSNAMSVTTADFGTTADGAKVTEYTCTNQNGMVLKMIDYGATVTVVEVPDRDGKMANVNLGYDSIAGYEKGSSYFGATVGRYCNRIAKGKFTIDGQEYTLATNNDPNHLHGGNSGFNRKMWDAKPIENDQEVGVEFSYTSVDGEEGYPGTVKATARYTINNDNELVVDLSATTDAPTHVNLTNHNYWNLGGAGSGTIKDHVLSLNCPSYLPVDETLIPTGEIASVKGTPFDFNSEPKAIGKDLEQVKVGDGPIGYDHCFVAGATSFPAEVATLSDPESGRVMTVTSDLRGLQVYTGNFLDGTPEVAGAEQYEAMCLETQQFPDSPNQSDKPGYTSSLITPDQPFHAVTRFKFSVE